MQPIPLVPPNRPEAVSRITVLKTNYKVKTHVTIRELAVVPKTNRKLSMRLMTFTVKRLSAPLLAAALRVRPNYNLHKFPIIVAIFTTTETNLSAALGRTNAVTFVINKTTFMIKSN